MPPDGLNRTPDGRTRGYDETKSRLSAVKTFRYDSVGRAIAQYSQDIIQTRQNMPLEARLKEYHASGLNASRIGLVGSVVLHPGCF